MRMPFHRRKPLSTRLIDSAAAGAGMAAGKVGRLLRRI
jgi:hypothetical protein